MLQLEVLVSAQGFRHYQGMMVPEGVGWLIVTRNRPYPLDVACRFKSVYKAGPTLVLLARPGGALTSHRG